MPQEEKLAGRNANDNYVDDEQRIRERLRAKLDSRNHSSNSNAKSSSTPDVKNIRNGTSTGTKGLASGGSETGEGRKAKENGGIHQESKIDGKNDGNKSRRRRRRHRGRRNRRGGNPFPPFPPPHMNYPPHRGSRSPPGHPPPGVFGPGPGYGPPPLGPYGGNFPPYGRPPPFGYDWRGPRGPPPPGRYEGGKLDDFGRRLPPSRNNGSRNQNDDAYRRNERRSYSRSRSRSVERRRPRSRSASSSASYSSESVSSRSASSRSSRSSKSAESSRRGSSASSRSLSDDESKSSIENAPQDGYTKDQRTVFVTQLVLRTTEKDIERYFRKQGIKTNEVILLRDKRTGRHKGSAYVELRRMEDLMKALELSGKPPDFQRFPVLIKASEAEKNYSVGSKGIVVDTGVGTSVEPAKLSFPALQPPLVGPNGKLIQAQKLYVGNLDPSVSQEHLFALFNPFGQLEQVTLQKSDDGTSKGFAFLQFRDPKEANLALQTMSGQMLAGRPIKTGWASQVSTNPSIDLVTSQEFPADSTSRAQTAYVVLAQLTVATASPTNVLPFLPLQQPESSGGGGSRVPTVAEARASLAAHGASSVPILGFSQALPIVTNASLVAPAPTTSVDPTKIGNASNPSKTVLVANMFDKDEETDPGWYDDIREEFTEECSKYGTIVKVLVMHTEPGGKIYATFDSITGAQNCASNLAGRWFDKRQLLVEYIPDSAVPSSAV